MIDLSDAHWRKSTRSGSGNTCVEVADLAPAGVALRDSTDPSGPTILLSRASWDSLSTEIKDGLLDLR